MRVYRITLARFSTNLYASGFVARWNSEGTFVIYTAGSRSLACLENLVHRSGEGLDAGFRVPSAIIPQEFNYILNPSHQEFKTIKLISSDEFSFDRRF